MRGTTSREFGEWFEAVWQRSDELFALIPESYWLERPIALRHPFLFYLGHLPAFAWNQICRGALGGGHLDQCLDQLYERGIDPEDEVAVVPRSSDYWPTVAETLDYRDKVRRAITESIDEVLSREGDLLCEYGRVLHLVIEHELMHHETLLYLLAAAPSAMATRPSRLPAPVSGAGEAAEMVSIDAGQVTIGAEWEDLDFGWDNEFGQLVVDLPSFRIDSLPVRNSDWYSFWRRAGDASLFPQSWIRDGGELLVRTVFGPVPFELAEGWPVQVSGDQARRYCATQGGRLPTEAELHRAAYTTPAGEVRRYPWGDEPPTAQHGCFGFVGWSPAPVGSTPAGASAWGVEELVGNGWEWTCSPFRPLPEFVPWARTYPGYSADFFDDAHDVVFGASWATDVKLLRPSFRNWYRRNYPYPFTSFRVVRG
ncbi:MAG: SUMF1/EgtB/PvdO family nonheme iron enzyme [Blastocatellia bacterium]